MEAETLAGRDAVPCVHANRPAEGESHISTAQLAANKANAQLSTGPRTEEGKAISSMNACKHNLSGGPAFVPGEDPAEYAKHHALIEEDYGPGTERAKFVVHQIADVMWRMTRLERMAAELAEKSANPFIAEDDDLVKRTERLERHRQNLERSYCRFSREWRALVNDDRTAERHELAMQQKRDRADSDAIDRQMREYLFAPPPGNTDPSHARVQSHASFQSRDREGAVSPAVTPPLALLQRRDREGAVPPDSTAACEGDTSAPTQNEPTHPKEKTGPTTPKIIWKRRKRQPTAA